MPPPAGARKGLPYNADVVPLRTTRTDLYTASRLDKPPTAGRGTGRFMASSSMKLLQGGDF